MQSDEQTAHVRLGLIECFDERGQLSLRGPAPRVRQLLVLQQPVLPAEAGEGHFEEPPQGRHPHRWADQAVEEELMADLLPLEAAGVVLAAGDQRLV